MKKIIIPITAITVIAGVVFGIGFFGLIQDEVNAKNMDRSRYTESSLDNAYYAKQYAEGALVDMLYEENVDQLTEIMTAHMSVEWPDMDLDMEIVRDLYYYNMIRIAAMDVYLNDPDTVHFTYFIVTDIVADEPDPKFDNRLSYHYLYQYKYGEVALSELSYGDPETEEWLRNNISDHASLVP